MRILPLMLLPAFALAGCAAESRTPPMSASRTSAGPANTEPEPANSLPRGASVQAPLTGPVGTVGPTQVGPSMAPSRSRY